MEELRREGRRGRLRRRLVEEEEEEEKGRATQGQMRGRN
jgi:hypothetical protein